MKAPGASGASRAQGRSAAEWREAHERLDRAEEALRRVELSDAQVEEILRERARALARAAERPTAPGRSVLVFTCRGARLGVDAVHAREILPLPPLAPVPRAPAYVAGLAQRRGEILMLVDVATLMRLSAEGLADMTKVVVIGAPRREVGLLADGVEGIEAIAPAAIAPALDEVPFVAGVASGGVVLLDAEALLGAVGQGRAASARGS